MSDSKFWGRFSKEDSTPLWLEEIPLETAAEFVLRHHYSKVMPKQTKIVLGAFKGRTGPLVGVITFGWGVRPADTIRRLFPSLGTKDYLEIGKMCVNDSEAKNTESRLLSLSAKVLKKMRPDLKLIFTWADALWGKPGYVYQAANYYYGGFTWTDVYMDKENRRFHPRQLPAKLRAEGLSNEDIRREWKANNEIGCCRPSKKQLVERGWKHVFGMQFRYVHFLTDEKEKELLIADSAKARIIKYQSTKSKRVLNPVTGKMSLEKTLDEKTVNKPAIIWRKPDAKNQNIYPKFNDIKWRMDDGTGKPVSCSKPEFAEAFDPNRL